MKIGNFLGSSISVDISFLESDHMRTARILGNIDIRKGFLEDMDINFGGRIVV